MGLQWQNVGVCVTLHVFIYVVEEISREKKQCFRPIKIWFGDIAYLFYRRKNTTNRRILFSSYGNMIL